MHSFKNDSKDITGMVSHFKIIQYSDEWKVTESAVVKESLLTIHLNDERIITLICSNNSKEFLAVGFLVIEGFIEPGDAHSITVKNSEDEEAIYIEAPFAKKAPCKHKSIITPGLGKGVMFQGAENYLKPLSASQKLKISSHQVFKLMKKLAEKSKLYKLTHGVHNAGLCTPDDLVIFQFDLGRHNAIDKIYGQCLLEKIPFKGKILVTSGRVSSEIIIKAGLMGIPILISRSAPSDRAIRLANDIGLTLIGRVHGNQLSVYSNPNRIVFA